MTTFKPVPLNTTVAEVKDNRIRCTECGWTTLDSTSGRLGIESHIRHRHTANSLPYRPGG